MNNKSLGSRLLMGAVTLGVLGYFAVQALLYIGDPLATTLAYTYEVEEGADLTGYVVRQEQVLSDDAGGLLRLQRGEGERVRKGGTVAAVYADQASLDRQTEIESLRTRIEQLTYAQEAALGSEASLKLDGQIMQAILDYRGSLTADKLYEAEQRGSELRALVLKRDYTYSDTGDLAEQITQLQSQLQSLQAQAAGTVRRITAPVSGLYSAVVDGYETVLTPDSLSELTPSALTAIRADTAVSSQVGKLVLGRDWYYAAVLDADAARELEEWTGELRLRFSKGLERDLPVTVESLGPEENSRVVIVFRGTTYLSELTLLRQQSAEVIRQTTTGIRVPKEALRVREQTVTDEDGNESVVSETGVYCMVGMKARFKPVDVLYSGDDFALVRSTLDTAEEVSETQEQIRLRAGDEVIITAYDLYDGKVIGS